MALSFGGTRVVQGGLLCRQRLAFSADARITIHRLCRLDQPLPARPNAAAAMRTAWLPMERHAKLAV